MWLLLRYRLYKELFMFKEIIQRNGNTESSPRKLVGQKPPLKLKEIWAIRVRLQIAGRLRDLALFNLAIDSKLRACDLVKLRVQDVAALAEWLHALS